jgi:hypothetical protein
MAGIREVVVTLTGDGGKVVVDRRPHAPSPVIFPMHAGAMRIAATNS